MSIFYKYPLNIYGIKNPYLLIITKNDNNMTLFPIYDRNYHNFIWIQAHFWA
jgi:hypothetical protein